MIENPIGCALPCRYLIWRKLSCLFILSVASLCLVVTVTPLSAQQDSVQVGKEALLKRTYPWYDAETDSVKKLELPTRPGSRTAERDSIKIAPPRPAAPAAAGGSTFFGGMSVFVWVLLGILLAVIVGLLVWAFLKMESEDDKVDAAANKRSMEESIKQLPFEVESADGDFLKAARAAYKVADYRKAIIYLFSHVLVSLDQQQLIRLRKGKTNRQYLRELRSHRELSDYYQHVMVPFEATFFGDHEIQQTEFEKCWNQLDEFQSQMNQTMQVPHG